MKFPAHVFVVNYDKKIIFYVGAQNNFSLVGCFSFFAFSVMQAPEVENVERAIHL